MEATQGEVKRQQGMEEHHLEEQPGPSRAPSTDSHHATIDGNCTSTYQVLYVPRERKCPLFRGTYGIGVEEWVEEVRACMRTRHLGPLDQAYFIFDHLEGEARDEIRFRPRAEREDSERVLTILKELYGCSTSYVTLQENFFSRKQLEGETLHEFSHALLALMEKVVNSAPGRVTNSAVLLRDQFVENVMDPNLRRELKRLIRGDSTLSFLDARAEAVRWEREGSPKVRENDSSASVCIVRASRATSQVGDSLSTREQISELVAVVQKQQEQINQLTQGLLALQASSQPTRASRPAVVCRRCQKPGHYARDCDNERVTLGGYSACSPQVTATTSSRPTEN